jgi:hypothetical protein
MGFVSTAFVSMPLLEALQPNKTMLMMSKYRCLNINSEINSVRLRGRESSIDTGTKKYKLQVLKYYNDAGSSGHITLRYSAL